MLERLEKGFKLPRRGTSPEESRKRASGRSGFFWWAGRARRRQTLEETLDFAAWRAAAWRRCLSDRRVRIYPGTTLHRIAISENVITRD